MGTTSEQYDRVINKCRDIFVKKMSDYGSAWRILRPSSLTDQIFIKANRIRTLETNTEQRVDEGIVPEYVGMVNYCIMALVQLERGAGNEADLELNEGKKLYDQWATATKDLMEAKNHDYGEAWREMRVSSLTDLILMKLLRIKQIEDNEGQTLISEGIDAGYQDIINYSVFALIKLEEAEAAVNR